MVPKKAELRLCAQRALEKRGCRVEVVRTLGVVPGGRLRIIGKAGVQRVAVRTSLEREVGLTRQPDGRWTTIPNVDQVIIVVPSADEPDAAEVFSFAPTVLMEAFDVALAARTPANRTLGYKAPIFVALDRPSRGTLRPASVGLKDRAEWREVVSLVAVRRGSERETTGQFIERVKREYAELHGVDVDNVSVEFRIRA
jgi:hypothetical protein